MIDMLIILLALSFSGIFLLVIYMNDLNKHIDELKEKLERQGQFEFSKLSELEDRIDKLEEVLELKEFYEQNN